MIDTDIKGLTPQFAVSPLCVSRGHISGPWPWAEQVGATLAAEADGPLQGLAEALQRSGSHRRDEAGQGCDSGERLDPFVTGLLQHREEEGKEKKSGECEHNQIKTANSSADFPKKAFAASMFANLVCNKGRYKQKHFQTLTVTNCSWLVPTGPGNSWKM